MVPKVQWDSTGSLNMLPLLAPRIRQNIFKTDFEATIKPNVLCFVHAKFKKYIFFF